MLGGTSAFSVSCLTWWYFCVYSCSNSLRHTYNIFLSTDKSIMGRKFCDGPFDLPGFCSAHRRPCVSSFGYSPVIATWLYILDIFYFSIGISSFPGLLLFFKFCTAFLISVGVKGIVISVGFIDAGNGFCIFV